MKGNIILCSACSWEKYDLIEYSLRRNKETNKFIFPDVSPAAQNNRPLLAVLSCMEIMRNRQINVKMGS